MKKNQKQQNKKGGGYLGVEWERERERNAVREKESKRKVVKWPFKADGLNRDEDSQD